ncbi:MAG: N-6 DNA methylase, partial [Leptospiraceae bacterium]|nr:N-6 DNA methylase [Leptospiraceae bacterium]
MINKEKLDNLTNEIWKSAEKLRGKFTAAEYQNIVLPIIMIRRLECVIQERRKGFIEEFKNKFPKLSEEEIEAKALKKEIDLFPKLSNKTTWTLSKIIKQVSETKLDKTFREYINGFSEEISELLLVHLGYNETITKMVKANRLYSIIEQYSTEELGPNKLSGLEVGYIYEELLKRFTQENTKVAGDHFTPREVIRLMVGLLELDFNPKESKSISLYDPACGTGGMLSVSKEHLLDKCKTEDEKKKVYNLVQLFGQEYQSQSFGICKMDMILREEKEFEITLGNSLIPNSKNSKEIGDLHYGRKYNYFISNPPFGVTWSEYATQARNFKTTRYAPGMPGEGDGALLFLLTMIEKMKSVEEGGSKICILFNGSPLSNGDCGTGESEIRRYLLENDLIESIVMLPDQMFYNTGIFTYIWVLNNNKPKKRKGKVLIINAREQFEKEPKSFGNKRNRMNEEHRNWVIKKFQSFSEDETCKLFSNKSFAYH